MAVSKPQPNVRWGASRMLMDRLSPQHRQQLNELYGFLSTHYAKDTYLLPFQTLSRLIQQYPRPVQDVVMSSLHGMDFASNGGRLAPYQERTTSKDVADTLEIPEHTAKAIYERAGAEQVAHDLQQRMGTDADRAPDPISRRDEVSAAYDAVMSSPTDQT